jgi:hypothetical protein
MQPATPQAVAMHRQNETLWTRVQGLQEKSYPLQRMERSVTQALQAMPRDKP